MWKNGYDKYKYKARRKAVVLYCLCAVTVMPLLASCSIFASEKKPVVAQDIEMREVPEKADPQGAIDEIYASLEECSVRRLTGRAIGEITGIPAEDLEESYVYYSDVTHGLADVIIVKPLNGSQTVKNQSTIKDKVRLSLYDYKDKRTNEFKDYDILGALSIADSAVIYDQGEYIIMLMLKDNEAAKSVIDVYIPQ